MESPTLHSTRSRPSTPMRSGRSSSRSAYPGTPSRRRSPKKVSLLQLSKLSLQTADTSVELDSVVILDFSRRYITAGFPGTPLPVGKLESDVVPVWGLTEDVEDKNLSVRLELMLHRVFYELLLIDPRKYRVMAVVPALMSEGFQRLISDLILGRFGASSIIFNSSSPFTMVASGSRNGLVVVIDWEETVVMPVIDFRDMTPLARVSARGGKWVFDNIREAIEQDITFNSIEKLLGQLDLSSTLSGDETVAYNGGSVAKAGLISAIKKALFSTDGEKDDEGEFPIDAVTTKVLQSLDVAGRGDVLENVVVTSDINIPGLTQCFADCLRKSYPKLRVIESEGSWCGASLYLSSVGWFFSHEDRALFPGELQREKRVVS
uniref:ARAD1D02574p n=1 Tax=Blastobotrys adeninivorans TaxID=409370 RepID=A0A060T7E3_BLAAD